jgi:DDE superfamily endonuclease
VSGRNSSCTGSSETDPRECEWKQASRAQKSSRFFEDSHSCPVGLTKLAFSWKPFLSARGRGYAHHPSAQCEAIEVPSRTDDTGFSPVRATFLKERLWRHVQVLVAGAILAPGCTTLSCALRAMGLDQEKGFQRYHRALSRASWSSWEASRELLRLLVETLVGEGDPLVVGIDETLEADRRATEAGQHHSASRPEDLGGAECPSRTVLGSHGDVRIGGSDHHCCLESVSGDLSQGL